MSGLTVIDGITISNWGPLTTTFTAPSSCATATATLLIGYNASPPFLRWRAECGLLGYWDCIPTGTVSITKPASNQLIQEHYFSPGLICPSGWETIGVAVKGKKDAISASGIFEASPRTLDGSHSFLQGQAELANPLVKNLKLSETLAVCCPSSFTPLAGAACSSTVSSYKPSKGCLGNSNRDTMAKAASIPTATKQATEPNYTSFDDELKPSLVAVKMVPMVNLVHHTSDVMAKSPTGVATTPSKNKNGAPNLSSGLDAWEEFRLVFGMSIVSMILGFVTVLWT